MRWKGHILSAETRNVYAVASLMKSNERGMHWHEVSNTEVALIWATMEVDGRVLLYLPEKRTHRF